MAPKTAASADALKTNTDQMNLEAEARHDEIDARHGIEDDPEPNESRDPVDVDSDPRRPALPKREVTAMSPGDAKRNAIIDRFKRPDTSPFDGDLTKLENLVGEVGAEELEPDPDAPEPGVRADQRQAADPAARQAEQPSGKTRTLLVRGQLVEMSEEDILKAAQKTLAGDSYLDDARRILEEAKDIKAERAGRGSQHPEDETQTRDDGQEPDRRGTERRTQGPDLKGLVEKIQFGDPEEAARALGEVITQQATETASKVADEGHVNRLIKNDLAKSQLELKAFRAANPDLDADPRASRMITQEIYDLYREEIKALGMDESQIPKDEKTLADWHRFYRVNGHEVSKTSDILNKAKDRYLGWRGENPTNKQPAKPNKDAPRIAVNVDRTERRQAIPQQPTRAVAPRRDVAPAQSPEESRKSAVQEMRRQRGQLTS